MGLLKRLQAKYLAWDLIEAKEEFTNGQEVRAGSRRKNSMGLVLLSCENEKSIL